MTHTKQVKLFKMSKKDGLIFFDYGAASRAEHYAYRGYIVQHI